jgi:hypothetical protein
MFLRRIKKRKCGKNHFYWALVESYRTDRGVRQRIVGYIGDVTGRKARGIYQSVERCESVQGDFLSPEELPERVEIAPRQTRTERQREFGGVWLGHKLFDKLGLSAYCTERFTGGR